jgi:hypothetical protein
MALPVRYSANVELPLEALIFQRAPQSAQFSEIRALNQGIRRFNSYFFLTIITAIPSVNGINFF